jgi:nucleoside-diphosphate-sugar epimerase
MNPAVNKLPSDQSDKMVLLTGGTGFLGAYVIAELVARGHSVRAMRHSSELPFFISPDILEKVEWVQGDILDIISLQDAMKGVTQVIHAAAIVSFHKSDRKKMYQVNVEGTANVVNAALSSGISRIVYVSSVAALGRSAHEELVNEEKKWQEGNNNTHYAISKHEAEMHVWRGFAEGLEGVIINPSTILGFGNWNQSSCAIFKNGFSEFQWYTNGINGFVGVEDVARVTALLLESGISQERFIVNADNWNFRKLFTGIAQHFHKNPPSREAGKTLGSIAWRLEKIKSYFTGSKPLLTRETAKVAHSKTSFDNRNILRVLPDFSFTPIDDVIRKSCEKYLEAVKTGALQ